ncbi:prolyl-tRNA synthetase [Bacilli bacterium PM5-3]|nr:prolyl-tRNA synthetase [Bacilli bacterium PM5-3]MDH6602885.1 prolyl-tRNA synthetase [Bacilli bacterium PM5-9]
MKQSRMFIPTTRNVIEEDVTSKSFMVMQKAGMIKQVAAGVFTYLPLAHMIIKNIEKICREELAAIGCVEMLMPTLQPQELWEESGRWSKYGPELMRLKDRHDRSFCLGPTHEEVVTSAIKDHVKSWRSLPLSLYQIQTKFRDEKRPRFGLMRGREFIMKDAYSFHTDYEGLSAHYDEMSGAYEKIFSRCGLKTIKVSADNGSIGGSDSTEFMSISEVGEDTLVYCEKCGYQANLEKASAKYDEADVQEEVMELKLIDTPNVSSIAEISEFLGFNPNRTAKYITYIDDATSKYYLVVCQGNYEINEVKLSNLVQARELRLLSDEELVEQGLIKGFIGAINFKAKDDFIVVADEAITKLKNHTAGGNILDTHYININYGRDYTADFVGDIKEVHEGDLCLHCDEKLTFAKGIEVGHIFKIGDVYTKAMKCTYLDKDQKEVPMQMGSYGIGVSRILMAVVETYAEDNNKIIWPKELQPFDVHLLVVDTKKEEQVINAEKIYNELSMRGIRVLYDDRKERPGSKFADSDLIGMKNRIVVGKMAGENIVEYLNREKDQKVDINVSDVVQTIIDNI